MAAGIGHFLLLIETCFQFLNQVPTSCPRTGFQPAGLCGTPDIPGGQHDPQSQSCPRATLRPPRPRSRPATPSPPSAPGSGSILAPVCRAPGTQAVLRGSHHPEGAPGRAHLPFVAPACPACTSLATRPRWPSPPRRPAPVLPSPPRAPLCLQTLRSGRSRPNQSPFPDFPGARPFIHHPRPRGQRGAETPAGQRSPARPLKREAAACSAPCGPHLWDGRLAPGGPQMGTVKPADG